MVEAFGSQSKDPLVVSQRFCLAAFLAKTANQRSKTCRIHPNSWCLSSNELRMGGGVDASVFVLATPVSHSRRFYSGKRAVFRGELGTAPSAAGKSLRTPGTESRVFDAICHAPTAKRMVFSPKKSIARSSQSNYRRPMPSMAPPSPAAGGALRQSVSRPNRSASRAAEYDPA